MLREVLLGKIELETNIKTARGSIEIRGGQIKITQREKIKRVGLSKLNSTQRDVGFENSTIASIPLAERSIRLNTTGDGISQGILKCFRFVTGAR